MIKWNLGEIAYISAGQGAPQGNENYSEFGTPFIKAGNLCDLINGANELSVQKVTEEIAKKHKLKIFPKGTIVFAKSGMSCMKGYVYELCNSCYIVNHLACITLKNDLPRYLKYFLEKNPPNLLIKDSAYPSISLSDIAQIRISLPPLNIQQRIVNVLDHVSDLIVKRREQLKKLDLLVKTLFVALFGDPVTNPMGWEVKCISEFTHVMTGATPNRSTNKYYIDGTIPWVKTGEISKGLIYESEEYITEKALKETNCKMLPVDTVMIAMYGVGKTRGESGILKIPAATNQACAAVLPAENYNTTYLHQFLQLQYKTLRGLGRGAQQTNLNLNIIKTFSIMFPPLSLQTRFADFVQQADKTKFVMQEGLKKMELCYNALMQKYFEAP